MERMWGGRRFETKFGKKLPPKIRIGESWEIVDRPEAQSVVRDGPLRGKTLHELWTQHRQELFGGVADSARFPLLIKPDRKSRGEIRGRAKNRILVCRRG